MERIKINGKNKPPEKKNIYYICNQERCFGCKQGQIRDCRYTTDIAFAKYHDHDPDEFDYNVDTRAWYERKRNG